MTHDIIRTFTRVNGEQFTVAVSVDMEMLVQRIAERMALHGRTERKMVDGAVVARII